MYARMCMWNFQLKRMYKMRTHQKHADFFYIFQLKLCKGRFHRASYLWHKLNFSHFVMCELVEKTTDVSIFSPRSNGTRTPCQLEGHRVLPKKCKPVTDHRMSPWWSLCTLYSSHARWSYRRRLGSLLLCDVSLVEFICTLYSSHARWSHRRRLESLLLWACVPCQLFERNYFPLFVDSVTDFYLIFLHLLTDLFTLMVSP